MKKKKEIKHNIETNIINPNIDNPKRLNIFTDGSVDQQNKKAGAAAIFVSQPLNNSNQMQVTEFLNIITKNPDSVIEDDSLNNTLNELYQDFQYQCPSGSGSMVTELIAIKKALENANDTPFSNTKSIVSLDTDYLSAIYAIQNFPPKDNHKLIFDIIYQINKNFEIRKTKLLFYWIPSHINITFNEIVDFHAKKALNQGFTVSVNPNLFSIKSTLWNTLIQKWKDNFTLNNSNSKSISKYLLNNPNFNPTTILPENKTLQTIITNLKINTFNSCTHLENTFCTYCFKYDNNFNINHYFFICPNTSPLFLPLINAFPDIDTNDNGCSFLLTNFQEPNITNAIIKLPPKTLCLNNHSVYFKHSILFNPI